ncbi:MAG: family 16 glycoside hydrolase [Pirellulales bacterium]
MKKLASVAMSCLMLAGLLLVSAPMSAEENAAEADFVEIFNGKDLNGWDGDPKFWSVRDGAITGQTTAENPTQGNTFIVWREGELDDFELQLKYRMEGGNSGIQYRSEESNKWRVGGYQADFESGKTYSGILYEERGRGILAQRGQKVTIDAEGKKSAEKFAESAELQKAIKPGEWNDYRIVAQGNHLTHYINGEKMSEFIDGQTDKAKFKGILALQLHAGPPMLVQFKDIKLKRLPLADGRKKVVFLAGRPSHGFGSHEHNAGCLLLANALNNSNANVLATVYTGGWPNDPTAFDNANAIVTYTDGGGRHPFNKKLDEIDKLAERGVGVVALHYGVETTKGEPGEHFVKWMGGYFEPHWSVNPHWTAKYAELPDHPVAYGVEPFEILDEWYYHMRFRPEMKGVTPILTALPPDSTLSRGDGAHSGNPHVREAVANGEPQHMAWVSERENGQRGFGFTGGHFHWNWGHDQFRKVVLNAITWTAGAEVPEEGVIGPGVTADDLIANQDYETPKNFQKQEIQAKLDNWNK